MSSYVFRVFNLGIITIMFEKSILQGLHAVAAVNVYSRALMFSGSSIAANIGGVSNEVCDHKLEW
jgi:hypothetical protein